MKIVAVLFILVFFVSNVYSQNADINLLKEINLHRCKSLDPTFKFITNTASPVAVATPLVIYSIGLAKDDSLLKKKAIYIGETFIVSAIITNTLKYTIKRDRPFITCPNIEKVTTGGSPSFPSGHTSDAFATATSLSIAFPKWYVIAPSFLWASVVGYSKMDLGVHYPSDVLAGAAIGAVSAILTYKLNRWLSKSNHKFQVSLQLSYWGNNYY